MLTFPSIVKVTVTGLRISAVDTTAFLDNCADLIPYAGSGRRIRIKDAAGKYLDGVIGARGTGETLSATELVTNPGFEAAFTGGLCAGWLNDGATSYSEESSIVHGGSKAQQVTTNANSGIYQNTSVTSGRLYKAVGWAYPVAGAAKLAPLSGIVASISTGTGAYEEIVVYGTVTTTSVESKMRLYANTAGSNLIWDDLSLKQVLAPSTSGLLIRNLAGAQSFQSKESGFTHNEASYAVEVFDMMRVV